MYPHLNNERSLSLVLAVVESFVTDLSKRISDKGMRKELEQLGRTCVAIADGKANRDAKMDYILQKWWLKANQEDPELVAYAKQQLGFND